MPYVTITPIPYNGGTLIPGAQRHFVRLTDTRFFCIYGQTTPNYTLGMVVGIDDLRAASPVATLLRTQTIPELVPSYTPTGYRLARLNDTDVLVFQQTQGNGFTMSVLRIDPGTNIITKVGNSILESWSTASNIYDTIQGAGQLKAVSDNLVIYTTGETGSNTRLLRKVTWNPGTTTLTRLATPLYTISLNSTFARWYSFAKAKDSNLWSLAVGYNASGATSTAYSQGVVAIGDPTLDTTWTAYSPTADLMSPAILPLTANTFLSIKDLRTWRSYVSSSPAPADIIFCPTAIANSSNRNIFVTWLNSDYFMIIGTRSTAGGSGFPAAVLADMSYVRICKYTDINFGQTSTSTTANVTALTTITPSFAYSTFEYVSPDIVLAYGMNGTTSFRLGILYSGSV